MFEHSWGGCHHPISVLTPGVPEHVGRKLCVDCVCCLVHVISVDMLKLRQDF